LPYGHIWWNEEKQVPQKWTMNAHLLDAGWKVPRCVSNLRYWSNFILRADEEEMQHLVIAENLETLNPEWNTGHVCIIKTFTDITRFSLAGAWLFR
jgi:hypothetical protein